MVWHAIDTINTNIVTRSNLAPAMVPAAEVAAEVAVAVAVAVSQTLTGSVCVSEQVSLRRVVDVQLCRVKVMVCVN